MNMDSRVLKNVIDDDETFSITEILGTRKIRK